MFIKKKVIGLLVQVGSDPSKPRNQNESNLSTFKAIFHSVLQFCPFVPHRAFKIDISASGVSLLFAMLGEILPRMFCKKQRSAFKQVCTFLPVIFLTVKY